ncbi:MAG: hypothetical protein ACR2NU_11675, partial [Aeoliella sp.]
YQGVGIGMKVVSAVADLHCERGHRVSVTSSHPALIHHCKRSPLWKTMSVKKTGQSHHRSKTFRNYHSSTGRAVVSFEFIGNNVDVIPREPQYRLTATEVSPKNVF